MDALGVEVSHLHDDVLDHTLHASAKVAELKAREVHDVDVLVGGVDLRVDGVSLLHLEGLHENRPGVLHVVVVEPPEQLGGFDGGHALKPEIVPVLVLAVDLAAPVLKEEVDVLARLREQLRAPGIFAERNDFLDAIPRVDVALLLSFPAPDALKNEGLRYFVELCRSDFGLELIVDCLFLISVGLELPESWGAAGHGRESEGGAFGEEGGGARGS
mmetsp:Transcript_9009/g.18472  ORF Transcript_9009/g.18472 Transcript_9009/m.18472 type:complete len:216 (-) Transcript_9009:14-661(-)